VTEKLSEQVARPYLRTPRTVIMQTTALTRKRRHEFVKAIDKGLAPPETPPEQRRVRTTVLKNVNITFCCVFQSQMAQAMAKNWIRDKKFQETDVDQALAVSIVGKCNRPNCDRPRAKNPCTGTIYDFCSLRCSRYSSTGLQHDAESETESFIVNKRNT
jgi:hypothetical protein